jgi:hypothetical protein
MSLDPDPYSRIPAVAGQFYPDDPDQLSSLVNALLEEAKDLSLPSIKALIVPHAGYIYSGPVAAAAYAGLRLQSGSIHRVVLLGPSHRVPFRGIATCSAHAYETPLGAIKLDRQALDSLQHLPQVQELDSAHTDEHSLEVQLPFLQKLLRQFTLVPLVVGECAAEQVAEVLQQLWGDDGTLIVISSDLSHYHPYAEAQFLDQKTSEAIITLKPEQIHYEDACGRNPINGMLLAARYHQLKCKIADLRNSGDTAGSRDRVVGYGAYIFTD